LESVISDIVRQAMFSSLFRSASPRQTEQKSPREPPKNQGTAKTPKFKGSFKPAAPVQPKANAKTSKFRDKAKAAVPAQPGDAHSKLLKMNFKDQKKALEEALAKVQGGALGVKAAKKDKAKTQSGVRGVKATKKAMVERDASVPRESRAKKGTSFWAKKRAARREALANGEEPAPALNKQPNAKKRKKRRLKDSEGDSAIVDASPKPNLSPRQLYKKTRWAKLRDERRGRKNARKKQQQKTAEDATDGLTPPANNAGKDGVTKVKKQDKQQSSTEGSTMKQEEQQQQQQQQQQKFSQSFLSTVNIAGGSKAARAAEKLQGSRFRWLNEMLYTSSGADAKKAFDEDPSLATAYHEGFRAQCAKWPRNPLDDVITWIRKEVPKGSVIGDFGCGEARLALELGKRYKTHSFDLVAINERITACNLANVPLPNGCLDVVVFCLALMGTDWLEFIREARRCLKPGGLLEIAEVESRFESIDSVVNNIQAIGFRKVMYTPGSFFIKLRFACTAGAERQAKGSSAIPAMSQGGQKRKAKASADQAAVGLRACKYRRR